MKKLDLTITPDTWELYQTQIQSMFDVDVEKYFTTVFSVKLNPDQLFQYEEGDITADELIEEMVY